MKTVFVTGAMGFLGTAMCQALRQHEYKVVALQRDWTIRYRKQEHAAHHVVHGDVGDMGLMVRTLAEYEVDAVIHLAAQAQVSAGSKDPSGTFTTNLGGTLSVLEACRLQKIKRVVVASTDKVYGDSTVAYTEDSPLLERNPYGASKACADIMAQTYLDHYRMSVAITRCGNLYGPGHLNWSTLIPGTLKRLNERRPPVLRFGGQAVRDFLYIEDAVAAYLKLLHSSECGPFNFSGGQPMTIKAIVELLLKMKGAPLNFMEIQEEGTGEIFAQALDCTRARELLGWEPEWKMEAGLAATTFWYDEYFKENPVCV